MASEGGGDGVLCLIAEQGGFGLSSAGASAPQAAEQLLLLALPASPPRPGPALTGGEDRGEHDRQHEDE